MGSSRRDLLPFPLPFPAAGNLPKGPHISRSIRRKLCTKQGWQTWANDGAEATNELYGSHSSFAGPLTASKEAALAQFCNHYRNVDKPPSDVSPAGAFLELCQNSLPYLSESVGPAPYDNEKISLPDACNDPANPLSCLSPEHLELISGPGNPMLRPEDEALHELDDLGLSHAHVDPAFNSQDLCSVSHANAFPSILTVHHWWKNISRCFLCNQEKWETEGHPRHAYRQLPF